jgi:hypothetical protein
MARKLVMIKWAHCAAHPEYQPELGTLPSQDPRCDGCAKSYLILALESLRALIGAGALSNSDNDISAYMRSQGIEVTA